MYYINKRRLMISAVPVTNFAIANAATVYSDSIDISRNVGFLTLLLTENKAGNGGNVNAFFQYSIDNVNFYTPQTTNAAALTADADAVDTFGNATAWIIQAARLAPFIRVGFTAGADSAVTADLMFQEYDA